MLTIICGEDSVSSRNYYLSLKELYVKKGYSISTVTADQLLSQNYSLQNESLFSTKMIFFTENINRHYKKSKDKKQILPELSFLSQKDIEVIDWENGLPAKEVKYKAQAGISIKEFKIAETIFKLLDACKPSNLSNFILLLRSVMTVQDQYFVFVMLIRHTRALILASQNIFSSTVQPWQKVKLLNQSKLWQKQKLEGWYEGLYRIDCSSKSGNNSFGLQKSLEILACHYL